MPDRERPLAGERPPKPLTRYYDRRRQALRRPLEPGVSHLITAATSGSLTADQGEEFGAEPECSLLELVEAGLPEWVEWSQAETFTPREFRAPIAVLQEVPPECLDETGRFVEPGWRSVEEA